MLVEMPIAAGPNKRSVFLLILSSTIIGIIFVWCFRNRAEGVRHPNNKYTNASPNSPDHLVASIDPLTLTGPAIAPKLANETAKAELGRAAWMLFHTVFARFPDKPTDDERTALQTYIHLFQRLYPCGECADHFRTILDKYPPQVSSRSAAAAWGCHVHNEVNKSLDKELFDCSNIGDFYDCGCAEDEKEGTSDAGSEKPEMSREDKERMSGVNGRSFDIDILTGARMPELEEEK